MVTLPSGRFWSFCCCAGVLGVITLKPDATNMLSLFCVLVCVLAQLTVSANSVAALIILNDTNCFIFLVPCRFAVVLGCFIGTREFAQERSECAPPPVYKTFVQHIRVAECTAKAQLLRSDALY